MHIPATQRAVFALALTLGLGACKDQALYDQDAADAGAVFDVAPPLDATVTVTSPAPGGTYAVGATIAFAIAVDGFTLVAPVDNPINERGTGHVRVTVDSTSGMELAQAAQTSFDVTVPAGVPNGEHDLVISLREKNGDPTGVEARVAVVFEGGADPDAGGADAAAGDAGSTDAAAPDAIAADAASADAGADGGAP